MLAESIVAGLVGLTVTAAVASVVIVARAEISVANDNYQLERARESVITKLATGGAIEDENRTNGCYVSKVGTSNGFVKFKIMRQGYKEERVAYVVWPADE